MKRKNKWLTLAALLAAAALPLVVPPHVALPLGHLLDAVLDGAPDEDRKSES